VNGSCRVRLRACVARGTTAECPAEPLRRVAAWAKVRGSEGIDLAVTDAGAPFSLPTGLGFRACLVNCDGNSDVECDVMTPIGDDDTSFGVPQPRYAGVPLCLVSRVATSHGIEGTADIATGELALAVSLSTDLHLTPIAQVCPTCELGRCRGGDAQGARCVVDGVSVVHQVAGDAVYMLSRDCLPSSPLLVTYDMTWHLTTAAAKPLTLATCETPGGPTLIPNLCGPAGCGPTCGGERCVALASDPVTPGGSVCRDAKGGLSRNCCNDDSAMGCFPLENGGTLDRHGWTGVPMPALPDPAYPTLTSTVLAGVACLPRTGSLAADGTMGLPGPAAMLLGGSVEWRQDTPRELP
jgi:hypothetical protein